MRAVSVLLQRKSTMEITIDIPDYLYNSLEKQAVNSRYTVEEIIIDILEETYG